MLTDASFINQRLFRGTLARMTLDGSPRPWLENVREAEWSPDGMTLATIRVTDGEDLLDTRSERFCIGRPVTSAIFAYRRMAIMSRSSSIRSDTTTAAS